MKSTNVDQTEETLQWLENFAKNGGIVQNNVNWSNLVGGKVNLVKVGIDETFDVVMDWQTRLGEFLTTMKENST